MNEPTIVIIEASTLSAIRIGTPKDAPVFVVDWDTEWAEDPTSMQDFVRIGGNWAMVYRVDDKHVGDIDPAIIAAVIEKQSEGGSQ